MTKPPVPVHYLRTNDSVWSPKHIVVFDTEATPLPGVTPETLSLRLWSAMLIDRKPTRNHKQERRQSWGHTAEQLADFLTAACKGRPTVWVFAHNLSFDLVTTRLPLTLILAGWSITDASIGGHAPWLRFARGRSRLTIVDSGSWFPTAVADIGISQGLPKKPLPAPTASDDEWLERCRTDVDITASAVVELLDWWDRNELGRWSLTGPSTGWHAMRHLPAVQRIVVDPDEDGIKADRAGIYSGRRGVWRVGRIDVGPLLELDFTAAYPTVAANLPLPLQRTISFDRMDITDRRVTSDRWSILAECVVSTDVPRYPVKVGKRVWYPVGEFRTTLCGPEITDAALRGNLVSIGAGHVHQLGHALLPWARWCLSVQNAETEDSTYIPQIVAKHWGRAVIGKWAARSYDKIELGPSPNPDWGYEEGWDHGSNTRGAMVDLGGRRWWTAASSEPDNAYPAILGWVESYVRVRLGRAIDAIGNNAIVQCDTDGFIVAADRIGTAAAGGTLRAPPGLSGDERAIWLVSELQALCAPLSIRIKRQYDTARILGPQHVDAAGERRFSGLPSSATHLGGDKYTYKQWPGLQWQMRNGAKEGYVRPEVSPTMGGPYASGWITDTNRVLPPTAIIGTDGITRLLPYALSVSQGPLPALAPKQNPYLTKVNNGLIG